VWPSSPAKMSSVRALGLALLPMGALAAAGASSSVLLVVAAGLAALALLAGVAFLFSVCIQRRELETVRYHAIFFSG